jgi:hypothetical protein
MNMLKKVCLLKYEIKKMLISTNISTSFNKYQYTFQPIGTLLILRGGARAGSAGRRARQFGRTNPGNRRLTLSPLASTRSPVPRRQVVAPEET